jgi:hypothetical protein
MPTPTTVPGATPDATGATPAVDQKPVDNQAATPDDQATDAGATPDDGLGDAGREAIRREREARDIAVKENRELKTRLKALEDKDLPEAERTSKALAEAERRNADLETRLAQMTVRTAVVAAAQRAGFADPEDAYRLIDMASVEFDAEGNPKGVDNILAGLLRTKPYLAASHIRTTGSADAGTGGPASGGTDMNQLIRQAAGRT